ncbi:MAG: hypothetical protein M9955_26380 [Rhizobiaceae bacterium]|uniref:hypothetical protein n=1 Tax=unclassified Shinella TaxID=2643062 RepID=UPI00225D1E43|nr:hypothetical protein [Shinella sp. YE25]MCO5085175.1 hypothetical protein [Rhizobiaceae bacterium]MDC7255750.1 hypothetical protein [Shinella sp. YE25]CAI0338571.1 hypothetical protein SHINE37_42425 [Rhizobiaceae bacterium]CAK7257011.1 protein of unknown function [Shinella sp. WSC3-e]
METLIEGDKIEQYNKALPEIIAYLAAKKSELISVEAALKPYIDEYYAFLRTCPWYTMTAGAYEESDYEFNRRMELEQNSMWRALSAKKRGLENRIAGYSDLLAFVRNSIEAESHSEKRGNAPGYSA